MKKTEKLSLQEKAVIIGKKTEPPFSGIYVDHYQKGVYVCRQCGISLYSSTSKFNSGCGWPSFDQEFEGSVEKVPDPDGKRTEIICRECKGHLGHVFNGEGFTDKNVRHYVNSLSIKFVPEKSHGK